MSSLTGGSHISDSLASMHSSGLEVQRLILVQCLLIFGFLVSLVVMLDWSSCTVVERTPGKVSGAWVFRGTRVPVTALFENLEDGARIDEFLAWFPGVSRQQAESVLEHAQRSLLSSDSRLQ